MMVHIKAAGIHMLFSSAVKKMYFGIAPKFPNFSFRNGQCA